jgi:hypothetical protein
MQEPARLPQDSNVAHGLPHLPTTPTTTRTAATEPTLAAAAAPTPIPAHPITAHALLHSLIRSRQAESGGGRDGGNGSANQRKEERLLSGFKELDEYVLLGGMERGMVVGVSAGVGGGAIGGLDVRGVGEDGGVGRLVS